MNGRFSISFDVGISDPVQVSWIMAIMGLNLTAPVRGLGGPTRMPCFLQEMAGLIKGLLRDDGD